jgi:N-methylhydantoinase B
MTVDQVTLNILGSNLLSISLEMGSVLLTSAYSSIVREAKDTSACLLDREGRLVSQAPMIPTHMNSMSLAFGCIRDIYPLSEVGPDDAFVLNNPYQMGQHLNDIILFVPAFHGGELCGFAGTVVHHVDIGGGAPASNAYASELYQEGLVLPALKVSLSRDLKGGTISKIIGANVRSPDKVVGDFHAQLASAIRGAALLVDLVERHGRGTVFAAMRWTQDHSERIMRERLRALPDGIYEGEDFTDSQDPNAPPVRIHVRVEKRGDSALVDLSGSDDEVRFPINAPVASVHSSVFSYFVSMVGEGTMVNDGSYRPVTIVTRPGSVCNPRFPAPVRSRMAVCYRVYTALKRAFGSQLPELVSACGADATNSIAFGHRYAGGYSVYHEVFGGGNGATILDDGEDCLAQGLSNTANTPVESLETEYAFMRVKFYGLARHSAGHGRHRGGLGARKIYEILDDDVTLSTAGDRHTTVPWGLDGGGDGSHCSYTIERRGELIPIGALTTCRLEKGDLVICETSAGGGHGNPLERPRALVVRDLHDGRVSLDEARDIYGFDPDEQPASTTASPEHQGAAS